MSQTSLTDRTVTGFLWIFTGTGTQAFLQFIVLIILARLLSPEEFGLVGAAMIVITFSQIFSQVGVGPAIVQQADLTERHIRAGLTLSLILSCVTGAFIVLVAPLIASFFRMPDLVSVIRALAAIFPITGISMVLTALLQREMRFRRLAIVDVLSFALGYGFVGVSFALNGWGVWALIFAQIGLATVRAGILLVLYPQGFRFGFGLIESGQLLNYGIGLSFAKIANAFAAQADKLVIGRWLGAEALGTYGRAYQFLMLPVNLLGRVSDKVLFPAMASIQQEQSRLGRAYLRAIALVAMVALPMSGVLVVLAPELVSILLGSQWSDVVLPFQLLACIMVFRVSYKISDSLVRAVGAVYRSAWRKGIYAVTVFIGAFIGQFWGIGGVAVGVGAAIVLSFFMMLHLSIKLTGISIGAVRDAYVRHIFIAVVITSSVWLVTRIGLPDGTAHVWTVLSGLGTASGFIILLWMVNRSLFGQEGLWLFDAAITRMRRFR